MDNAQQLALMPAVHQLQDPRSGEKVDKDLWVTRKGATSAQKGQYGIIPGSMGVGSFITKVCNHGKASHSTHHGNYYSYNSNAHTLACPCCL